MPRIEEEKSEDDSGPAITTVTMPTPIYQTSSGQYSKFNRGMVSFVWRRFRCGLWKLKQRFPLQSPSRRAGPSSWPATAPTGSRACRPSPWPTPPPRSPAPPSCSTPRPAMASRSSSPATRSSFKVKPGTLFASLPNNFTVFH